MIRSWRVAIGFVSLIALALPGCSRSPRHASGPVHLSPRDPDGNAAPIVDFFRATCLDSMTEPSAFEDALRQSGWPLRQTQAAGQGTTLSVWSVEHGQLLYSTIPLEAHGMTGRDCHLALDSAVAPGVGRMRQALRSIIDEGGLSEIVADDSQVSWHWQPTLFEERDLTISALPASQTGGRPGLAIHVESTQYNPLRRLFGN
jgi:hypothetical protein